MWLTTPFVAPPLGTYRRLPYTAAPAHHQDDAPGRDISQEAVRPQGARPNGEQPREDEVHEEHQDVRHGEEG